MTSPVDTLKALVDAVEAEFCGEATERLEPDDSKASYPEDRCHITFGHIRRAKAAIAALSGGEAEPVAWCALNADGGIAYFDGKPMVMPGKVGNYIHPVPLYTTPRAVPDGMVLVPREPTEAMLEAGKEAHYEAEVRCEHEASFGTRGMMWRKNRAAHVYAAMLAAAPGDEGRGDASRA